MANQETLAFFKALQAHYSDDGTILSISSGVNESTSSEGAYRALIKALMNDKQALQKELNVSNAILKDANLYHLVILEK
jgi:hypothetical protein